MVEHPVRITAEEDDLVRPRLGVFFRIVLAIPHYILLNTLGAVAIMLAPFVWIATLFTGIPPAALTDFYRSFLRYTLHVSAYLTYAARPYPPFLGGPGSYPVDVAFPPYERQSRWSVGFRFFLALPAILLTIAHGSGLALGMALGGTLTGIWLLGWFACLARGRMAPGMKDLAVYSAGYGIQAFAYLFLLTGRYPDSDPALYPSAPLPAHPVRMTGLDDAPRRSRMLVFFRLMLSTPHFLWHQLWTIVALVAWVLAWLCALATGRVPWPLHRFLAAYVRYTTHFYAFFYLASNPFPGFVGTAGSYPLDVAIDPPAPQPRWGVLFRVVLVLPALLLVQILMLLQYATAFLSWWAALFTGRQPRGMRNAQAYALRYNAQVWAYGLLLTARYPYSGPGDWAQPKPVAELAPALVSWFTHPELP